MENLLQALQSQQTTPEILQMMMQAQMMNSQAANQRAVPPAVGNSGMATAAAQWGREHSAGKKEQAAMEMLVKALGEQQGYSKYQAQLAEMQERQRAEEEFRRKSQLAQGAGYAPGQAEAVAGGIPLPEQPKQDKPPTVVAALQAAGIPPDSPEGQQMIRQYLTKGNQTTQITIPTGYAPVDPSNPTAGFKPIPGSPQAMEVEQRAAAEADAGSKRAGSAQNVLQAIDRLKANTGPTTAGWGGLLANVPSSAAKTYKNDLNTVMANLAFDRLQEMRDASKTGGALGQVSNIELDLLKSTVAGLEQTQNPDDLKERLDIVAGQYKRFTDALTGAVPEGYETKEIPGRGKFIKIEDQWFPL